MICLLILAASWLLTYHLINMETTSDADLIEPGW